MLPGQSQIECFAMNQSFQVSDEALQHRWADEAAMWLACTNEVNLESEAMGRAMQVSLTEAEEQKKLEKPIHEQTQDQLKSRYDSSRVLKQVHNIACRLLPASMKFQHFLLHLQLS